MRLWHGSLTRGGELLYVVRDASGDARCLLCGGRLGDDEGEVARHPLGRLVVACRRCRIAATAFEVETADSRQA